MDNNKVILTEKQLETLKDSFNNYEKIKKKIKETEADNKKEE